MSERYDVFHIQELSTMSCKCGNCGTVILFDMASDDKFGLPKRCSTCNEPLGAAAQAFNDYRRFYASVTASGAEIKLHTKATSGGE